ncbi:bifunctional tRNA (5-methylaminomethyl-2-thiouridine)(34)-methyltransferase MnmD/FAD-dependent 5-carboxymethylaminomethyl-2-thiouridine(34) oxidoreductase MnmC [Halomonas sediminis]
MSHRFPALPPLTHLTPPPLDWQDGAPHSRAFDDVYFSRQDGRAETEHVFLHANRLPERFAQWAAPRPFVIGETGFGSGLNMLCAWACFEVHAPPGARLHLISTEKYPMRREDLAQALSAWPTLADHARVLLEQWPPCISGVHRLWLSDAVTLDLHFGDTTERLQLLDGLVDAWFLDGFAPSKNPQMWQPELFDAMAARSRPGATFATFTCAGIVKRGLKAAGFAWRKEPGFGRKREMLAGEITVPPADQRRKATPWFTPPALQATSHVAVIGAGIAGTSVAEALARRGVHITLLDRDAPGAGGSGNRQGALYVKLAAQTNLQSRFYLAGLMHSRRWLARLDPEQQLWRDCGVTQLALTAKEAQRQARFARDHEFPDTLIEELSPVQAGERIGMQVEATGALDYPQAGWVRPQALCDHLAQRPGIHFRKAEVASLKAQDEGWLLTLENGETLQADQVVIATASLADSFHQTRQLPLQAVRGQVTQLALPSGVANLKRVVCAGGYVSPAWEGVLTFGASFIPGDTQNELREAEHQSNLEELKRTLPSLVEALEKAGATLDPAQLTGRAAIRAASPDKTPYAGPVPNAEAWQTDYALLSKDAGRVGRTPGRHHAGLWISAAHGSRGLASAALCAEVIASRMCDEPLPLEAPLVDHLHPGRRLISALIRRPRP